MIVFGKILFIKNIILPQLEKNCKKTQK